MTITNSDGTTQIITCECSICGGKSAEVRGSVAYNATRTHGIVQLAHSRFAASPQQKALGPWAVASKAAS